MLPAMTRITLRGLLRSVLGADGSTVDELSALLPTAVSLGARIGLLPPLVRKDFGAWSPGARLLQYRSDFDTAVYAMMAAARADPAFAERTDILAILLQARYDNGESMSDAYIADELLSLLAAGYETTAATLAWAVERLRRRPQLLARLTAEVDAGGSQWRQATIWEVQRARPVSDYRAAARNDPNSIGRVGHTRRHHVDDQRPTGPLVRRQLPRRRIIRSGQIRRYQARGMDSLRRRIPTLYRRDIREHGDGRDAAHATARISARTH